MISTHGFEPVLNRLAAGAGEYFDDPSARFYPVGRTERPFSTLLRLRVITYARQFHAFVKIHKPRLPVPFEVPRELREFVESEYQTMRTVHAALESHPGLGVPRPVAIFVDNAATVTEEAPGMPLDRLLKRAARLGPGDLPLEAAVERIGAWVRAFQSIYRCDGQSSLEEQRGYIDDRLRFLTTTILTSADRARALAMFDELARSIPDGQRSIVGIHADLCPGNILVTPTGDITVLDFAMTGCGTRFHDVSHLFMHFEFLRWRPHLHPGLTGRLQAALLRGFDPAASVTDPRFTVMLLQHVICHVAFVGDRPAGPLQKLRARRAWRRWEKCLAMPALDRGWLRRPSLHPLSRDRSVTTPIPRGIRLAGGNTEIGRGGLVPVRALKALKTVVGRRGVGYLGYLVTGVTAPRLAYQWVWGPPAPSPVRKAFRKAAGHLSTRISFDAPIDIGGSPSDIEEGMGRAHAAGFTGVRHGFDRPVRNLRAHADRGAAFAADRDADRCAFNARFDRSILTEAAARRLLQEAKARVTCGYRDYAPIDFGGGITLGRIASTDSGTGRWEFFNGAVVTPLVTGRRVLDLGSNNGSMPLMMLRAGARSVTGIEASPEIADLARLNGQILAWRDLRPYDLRIITGDMRLMLDETSMGPADVVTAFCSLYYLPEADMARIITRAAAMGATLILQANEAIENLPAGVDPLRRLMAANGYPSIATYTAEGFSRPLLVGHPPRPVCPSA